MFVRSLKSSADSPYSCQVVRFILPLSALLFLTEGLVRPVTWSPMTRIFSQVSHRSPRTYGSDRLLNTCLSDTSSANDGDSEMPPADDENKNVNKQSKYSNETIVPLEQQQPTMARSSDSGTGPSPLLSPKNAEHDEAGDRNTTMINDRSTSISRSDGGSSGALKREEIQLQQLRQESFSKGIIPIGAKNLDQIIGGSGSNAGEDRTGSGKIGANPRMNALLGFGSNTTPGAVKYFKFVQSLTPNDMLQKFASKAPQNVQEAAKSTVMNILGSLPNYALDASMITTNTKLANLLYQMQITGYMFKNAEIRMSLTRGLKGLPRLLPSAQVKSGNLTFNPKTSSSSFPTSSDPRRTPLGSTSTGGDVASVSGRVTVRTVGGKEMEVDVSELTSALSKEVEDLRAELANIRSVRETELKANLLTYIQALPEQELSKLTSDMGDDVVQAIQMLVNAMMEKMGIDNSGPEVLLQQNVAFLAQLCMWQMVVGYKLRELEAFDKGVSMD